jgi:hypothetical protein
MNTKQAKEFLVQQTAEQAALDNVPLSDIEKRMMYFTESDNASCDNPLEVNDEFEAQYDTAEYEAKISRILHHAYHRLKGEAPERKRMWDLAIRELRKGDHYFLVLWDIRPPTEHPTRDFFKLLAVSVLVAIGIGIAVFVAIKYDIDFKRYRNYVLIIIFGLALLASGSFRAAYRVAIVWLRRRTMKDEQSN